MKRKQIHFLFSILLSVLLVTAGLCMMIACVGIYHAGEQPFSREAVATAFGRITIPVYICLAGVLLGLLLDLILPEKAASPLPQKPYRRILDTMKRRLDMTLCDPQMQQEAARLERNRQIHKTVSRLLLIVGSAAFLFYGLDPRNYHDTQINGSVIRAMYVLLGSMAIPFCYGIFEAFYSVASIRREIELLKQAPGSAKVPAAKPAVTSAGQKTAVILRTAVLAAALFLMLFGYFTGGTADVMTKAVNICTECVGLG